MGVGHGYRAVRTVPAVVGNAAPDIEARTVLTVYGLCHVRDGANHPLVVPSCERSRWPPRVKAG